VPLTKNAMMLQFTMGYPVAQPIVQQNAAQMLHANITPFG
jgi:hypothetical protein